MRTVTKQVYYCDFCGRYRLRRSAIETHEPRCTLNPDRVCRWDLDYRTKPPAPHPIFTPVPALVRRFAALAKIDAHEVASLHDAVNGCPACMLTVIRCSGRSSDVGELFVFKEEVARRNQERREEEQEQEYAAIQASWL